MLFFVGSVFFATVTLFAEIAVFQRIYLLLQRRFHLTIKRFTRHSVIHLLLHRTAHCFCSCTVRNQALFAMFVAPFPATMHLIVSRPIPSLRFRVMFGKLLYPTCLNQVSVKMSFTVLLVVQYCFGKILVTGISASDRLNFSKWHLKRIFLATSIVR